MKIVDYIFFYTLDDGAMTDLVRDYIKEGRQPFGSAGVAVNDCDKVFSQAMVKYEETDKQ